MCYYSTIHPDTREAKEGEDMHVGRARDHGVLKGSSDQAIVCVQSGSTLTIENLQFADDTLRNPGLVARIEAMGLKPGQNLTARFIQYHGPQHDAYACDAIEVRGMKLHISWLRVGTKCYFGKKVSLETKLGMDDPSIVLDYREETPTVARTLARVDGLCSITR